MQIYAMNKLNDVEEIKTYDAFFCANGLERRDVRAVEVCLEKKFQVKKWIIFDYEERVSKKEDEGNVVSKLEQQNTVIIKTSYNDSRSYITIMQDICEELQGYSHIGIDITGFKIQSFYPLLKTLRSMGVSSQIDVFYTEPATYRFPTEEKKSSIFPNMKNGTKDLFYYSKVEDGIEIKSIPGFEGEKAKKTLLIIVLGFDGNVANRIREKYGSEKVLLINGFPAYLPKFRDISLLNNKELVKGCDKNEILNTYADNPFEIYNVLFRIQRRYEDYKLLVAPLGAKPLALGVCKFVIDYPQNAVLYVESNKYVEKSTEAYGDTWEYQLNFTNP